jgi:hypothetical protein
MSALAERDFCSRDAAANCETLALERRGVALLKPAVMVAGVNPA